MLVVTFSTGVGGTGASTAMLLPALGTYDGRLVVATEPATFCTMHSISAHIVNTFDFSFFLTSGFSLFLDFYVSHNSNSISVALI